MASEGDQSELMGVVEPEMLAIDGDELDGSFPVSLQPRYVFGVRSDVKNGVHFIDEKNVVYVAGNNIVQLEIEHHTQTFLPTTSEEGELGICCTALSSDRRYLAVGGRHHERAIITVFDLASSKKVKTLQTDAGLEDIDCMAFSDGEEKYIVALSTVAAQVGPQHATHTAYQEASADGPTRSACKLSCWSWDAEEEVSSSVDLLRGYPSTINAKADHVSFFNSTRIGVTGINLVAVYERSDAGELMAAATVEERLQGLPASHRNASGEFIITNHLWTQAGDILCATAFGNLVLFDQHGVFKYSLSMDAPTIKGAYRTMIPWSRGGFLAVGEDSVVRMLRRNSDDIDEPYRLSRVFTIDPPGKFFRRNEGSGLSSSYGAGRNSKVSLIKPVSVSLAPSENYLAVITECGQLLCVPLRSVRRVRHALSRKEGGRQDEKYNPVEQMANWMLCSFHSGLILGMGICARKPIVATCGVDNTVRFWNFRDRRCELEQYFMEDAFSIALHPSGLQALIGFIDRLRLMDVLRDELKTYRDFPHIKSCRECRFSNGGHMFAAACGNSIEVIREIIDVYKTYTCELLYHLKGHNNKVRTISWNWDDSRLVSGGLDGAVYEYNIVAGGQRISDWVNKTLLVSSTAVWTDTSTETEKGPLMFGLPVTRVYVVGNTKSIREVYCSQLQNTIGEESPCEENDCADSVNFGQICVGESTRMMFVSTSSPNSGEDGRGGAIRCYRLPSSEDDPAGDNPASSDSNANANFLEYPCHFGEVTRMAISDDERLLFTCGEDGCVYVFDIWDKSRLPVADGLDEMSEAAYEERNMPYSDEVLVTKAGLEEQRHLRKDLKRQVDELTTQSDYQLRQREVYHAERIAEMGAKFQEALQLKREQYGGGVEDNRRLIASLVGRSLQTIRLRYEKLREEKKKIREEYMQKVEELSEKLKTQLQEQEVAYQEKIVAQVTKCQKLANKRYADRRRWRQMHGELLDMHEKKILDLREQFRNQDTRDRQHKQRVVDEKALAIRVHSETVKQLEQDADNELNDLKAQYEQLLARERDDKVKLRGEAGIHKKHHEELKKHMHKKDEEIRSQQEEVSRRQERIDELMAEREKSLRDIKEQDQVIGEKEQKIYDLKKRNQELEKYRYILDHRIEELKEEVGPRSEEIAEVRKQISDMDHEMEEQHKQSKNLMEDIEVMRGKQKELQREVVDYRQRLSDLRRVSNAFKTDLYHTTQHILDPEKLKESFLGMARKYIELPPAKEAVEKEKGKDEEGSGDQEEEDTEEEEESEDEEVAMEKRPHTNKGIHTEHRCQKAALEARVNNMKMKLQKDAEARRKDNSRIMAENMGLLTEIGDLRKELQALKIERSERKLSITRQGPLKGSMKSSERGMPAAAGEACLDRAEIERNRKIIAELRAKIREKEDIIHAARATTGPSPP